MVLEFGDSWADDCKRLPSRTGRKSGKTPSTESKVDRVRGKELDSVMGGQEKCMKRSLSKMIEL